MATIQLILTVFLGLFAAFKGLNWKRENWKGISLAIISAILAIIIGYNSFIDYKEAQLLKEVNKTFGNIEDLHGASIPIVIIGHSTAKILNGTPDGILLKDGLGGAELKTYVKNNLLVVTAILRDFDGHLIAVINKNQWVMVDQSNMEYNNDQTAFEVVSKGIRKVYFQIELIKGEVSVTGLFVNKHGNGSYWLGFPESDGVVIPISKGVDFEISTKIDPLFDYPREVSIGVRAKN